MLEPGEMTMLRNTHNKGDFNVFLFSNSCECLPFFEYSSIIFLVLLFRPKALFNYLCLFLE